MNLSLLKQRPDLGQMKCTLKVSLPPLFFKRLNNPLRTSKQWGEIRVPQFSAVPTLWYTIENEHLCISLHMLLHYLPGLLHTEIPKSLCG